MSRCWLGLLLFGIVIGSSGIAHAAALTGAPDPQDIGNVPVGQSGSKDVTISAVPSVTVASFDVSAASCAGFAVSPQTLLPLNVGNGPSAKTVTVSLTATAPGFKSCTIIARDNMGNALGM